MFLHPITQAQSQQSKTQPYSSQDLSVSDAYSLVIPLQLTIIRLMHGIQQL